MIGIYKITSPNNNIYIGQSINIEKRFVQYKKLRSCCNQIKLYNSFVKYGVDNHIFEIIEECNIEFFNYLITPKNIKIGIKAKIKGISIENAIPAFFMIGVYTL